MTQERSGHVALAKLRLEKLHGGGNDFLVLEDLGERFGKVGASVLARETVAAICDRATGVGADGLIRLLPGSAGADCTMELWNADGGIAEMSGNGIRCLAAVAGRLGLGGSALEVTTLAGRRTVELERAVDGEVRWATVDMGQVSFDPAAIPVLTSDPLRLEVEFAGERFAAAAAGLGNPHLVVLVDVDFLGQIDVARHGPDLERDPRFPARANVSFVAPRSGGLAARVWERGVGETRSCGTGACAAAAVAHLRGLVGPSVVVSLPGGRLEVQLGDSVRLRGPVASVFEVSLDLGRLGRSAAGLSGQAGRR